jgi:hypothetical protein
MNVTVLGHSFIRRLRDDLIPPHNGRGYDINAHNPTKAARLAHAMGVSDHVTGIYTECNNMAFISDLDRSEPLISRTSPGIVLIDMGSNDVAHMERTDPNNILLLATQLTDFASELQVGVVIINSILPRTARISCSAEIFKANADLFNLFVNNICSTSDTLVYHRIRGFSHTCIDGTERERKVSEWSTDGIHCTTKESKKQYMRRVRRAILTEVNRAKRWANN